MNPGASAKRSLRILVIGVGNYFRGDDAAGIITIRNIRPQLRGEHTAIEHSGEGADIIETWKSFDIVLLIDAVQSASVPGTIHRLEAHKEPIPAKFFSCSSHAFSVAQAVELARALNLLPPKLIIYGIEGRNFAIGAKISSEVSQAISEVTRSIMNYIELMEIAEINEQDS